MKQMKRVADEKEQMQRVDVVSASYMASWVTGWWVVSSMGLEKLVYDTARSFLALTNLGSYSNSCLPLSLHPKKKNM